MTIRANSRIEYAVVIEMHSICALEIWRLWNMNSLVDGRAAVFIFNKYKKYHNQKTELRLEITCSCVDSIRISLISVHILRNPVVIALLFPSSVGMACCI